MWLFPNEVFMKTSSELSSNYFHKLIFLKGKGRGMPHRSKWSITIALSEV